MRTLPGNPNLPRHETLEQAHAKSSESGEFAYLNLNLKKINPPEVSKFREISDQCGLQVVENTPFSFRGAVASELLVSNNKAALDLIPGQMLLVGFSSRGD